jgi:hypothetical protein
MAARTKEAKRENELELLDTEAAPVDHNTRGDSGITLDDIEGAGIPTQVCVLCVLVGLRRLLA